MALDARKGPASHAGLPAQLLPAWRIEQSRLIANRETELIVVSISCTQSPGYSALCHVEEFNPRLLVQLLFPYQHSDLLQGTVSQRREEDIYQHLHT
jgi:hypothetical protein